MIPFTQEDPSDRSILTPRLLLRMLSLADRDELFQVYGDPDVARYVGNGLPATQEETETALQSILAHWERHGWGRWAAIDPESGRLIGCGGLRSLFGTPEVVYHLAKPSWGKGLATEIACAAIRYGFEKLGFERIVAIAKPPNAASIRVMQKIGMSFECLTSYYSMDVVQYGIHRDAYLQLADFYRDVLGR